MSDIEVGSVWVSKKNKTAILKVSDVEGSNIETHWLGTPQQPSFNWGVDDFLSKYDPQPGIECKATTPKAVQILNDQVRNKFGLVGRPIGILAQARKDSEPKAVQILNEAVQIMAERGKSYDKSGGQAERSMPKIVTMFNALTGHELTPAQGWKFMACLKLARSEQGEHREDNYLDGAAYFALAGEEAGEDSK